MEATISIFRALMTLIVCLQLVTSLFLEQSASLESSDEKGFESYKDRNGNQYENADDHVMQDSVVPKESENSKTPPNMNVHELSFDNKKDYGEPPKDVNDSEMEDHVKSEETDPRDDSKITAKNRKHLRRNPSGKTIMESKKPTGRKLIGKQQKAGKTRYKGSGKKRTFKQKDNSGVSMKNSKEYEVKDCVKVVF